MAIAEYASTRYSANGGTAGYTNFQKDWAAPNLLGTGVVVILALAIAGEQTITHNPARWTRIGSPVTITGIVENSGSITFPGGLTLDCFWAIEPFGSNSNHIFSWPTAVPYAVASVGFSGISSSIGTVNTDFGGASSSSNTLVAQQGFSAGQAGDLVITVGATRVGAASSGTTYGVGTWTGGVGGLPTTTYNTTPTGKSLGLRLAGVLQATGGQAIGGHTAPFTGQASAATPKLWVTHTFVIKAQSSATRRSFVYV